MNDKQLLDALDSGAILFNQFRRRQNGTWEWWCQKDGPANNRWVQETTLRDCLGKLIDQKAAMDAAAKPEPAKK